MGLTSPLASPLPPAPTTKKHLTKTEPTNRQENKELHPVLPKVFLSSHLEIVKKISVSEKDVLWKTQCR